jgi:hypothetical protein
MALMEEQMRQAEKAKEAQEKALAEREKKMEEDTARMQAEMETKMAAEMERVRKEATEAAQAVAAAAAAAAAAAGPSSPKGGGGGGGDDSARVAEVQGQLDDALNEIKRLKAQLKVASRGSPRASPRSSRVSSSDALGELGGQAGPTQEGEDNTTELLTEIELLRAENDELKAQLAESAAAVAAGAAGSRGKRRTSIGGVKTQFATSPPKSDSGAGGAGGEDGLGDLGGSFVAVVQHTKDDEDQLLAEAVKDCQFLGDKPKLPVPACLIFRAMMSWKEISYKQVHTTYSSFSPLSSLPPYSASSLPPYSVRLLKLQTANTTTPSSAKQADALPDLCFMDKVCKMMESCADNAAADLPMSAFWLTTSCVLCQLAQRRLIKQQGAAQKKTAKRTSVAWLKNLIGSGTGDHASQESLSPAQMSGSHPFVRAMLGLVERIFQARV